MAQAPARAQLGSSQRTQPSRLLLTAATLLSATPAVAQTAGTVSVPEGTKLHVVTTGGVSSRTAAVGDPVTFKVDEAVVVGGHVVVERGALVRGTVSMAKRAGRMGTGGKLHIMAESVSGADGTPIPLRAAQGRAGDDKTGTTATLAALFGPLGLLRSGRDAEIKAGTPVTVFTDSTVAVRAR